MIKQIIYEDNGETKTLEVMDGLGIFICKGEDEPFVVSQMSDNQSIQLAMLKSILKQE